MASELVDQLQNIINTNAIDFEIAQNWKESIGRCLFYSLQTGKPPAIILTLENPEDHKHLEDLSSVIEHFKLPIKVFPMSEPKD